MQANTKNHRKVSKGILCFLLCICCVISFPNIDVSAASWSPGNTYVNGDYGGWIFIIPQNADMPYYKVWIANTGSTTINYSLTETNSMETKATGTLAPGAQTLIYGGSSAGDYVNRAYWLTLSSNNNQTLSAAFNYRIATTYAELG